MSIFRAPVAAIAVLAAGCGSSGASRVDAGPSPDLGCAVFPGDNPWNTSVVSAAVHAQSDTFIDSIGGDRTMHPDFGTVFEGAPLGIPFTVVGNSTAEVEVELAFDDSDPGPYRIPADAPIEGGPDSGGDRHVIVVNEDTCELHELYRAFPNGDGTWRADSGAKFDLGSNALRPDGNTSADAAGLPILAGLVRYQEVVIDGAVNHAIRVTVNRTQQGFIHPATHAAGSNDDSAPPMGLRLRMRPGFDCSALSSEVQVLCTAFKTYGLFVADNGSSWFVSGAPDPRWDDGALADLREIPGSAFEAVETGPIIPQ